MNELPGLLITLLIVFFLILLIWARVEHKEIMDILQDIKELISPPEVVK